MGFGLSFLHPTQLPGHIGGCERIFKNNIPNIPDDLVLDLDFFVGGERDTFLFFGFWVVFIHIGK